MSSTLHVEWVENECSHVINARYIICFRIDSDALLIRQFVDEKVKYDASEGEVSFIMKLDIDELKHKADLPRQQHVQ